MHSWQRTLDWDSFTCFSRSLVESRIKLHDRCRCRFHSTLGAASTLLTAIIVPSQQQQCFSTFRQSTIAIQSYESCATIIQSLLTRHGSNAVLLSQSIANNQQHLQPSTAKQRQPTTSTANKQQHEGAQSRSTPIPKPALPTSEEWDISLNVNNQPMASIMKVLSSVNVKRLIVKLSDSKKLWQLFFCQSNHGSCWNLSVVESVFTEWQLGYC